MLDMYSISPSMFTQAVGCGSGGALWTGAKHSGPMIVIDSDARMVRCLRASEDLAAGIGGAEGRAPNTQDMLDTEQATLGCARLVCEGLNVSLSYEHPVSNPARRLRVEPTSPQRD